MERFQKGKAVHTIMRTVAEKLDMPLIELNRMITIVGLDMNEEDMKKMMDYLDDDSAQPPAAPHPSPPKHASGLSSVSTIASGRRWLLGPQPSPAQAPSCSRRRPRARSATKNIQSPGRASSAETSAAWCARTPAYRARRVWVPRCAATRACAAAGQSR